MPHLSSIKRLGRAKDHRVSLVRNLTKNLLTHGKMETTHTKARVTSQYIDRLFTRAMKPDKEQARRAVFQMINDAKLTDKVMNVYLNNLNGRKTGFTSRVILRNRPGDNAEIVLLTLLTVEEKKVLKTKAEKAKAKSDKADKKKDKKDSKESKEKEVKSTESKK
jgi:large subunit ribosomal protein L17